MKLAILGTGKIVAEVLPLLPQVGVERVVLLSTLRSLERAEQMKRDFGLDGVYTDYETLLDGDVDAVYVALPNHLHHAYAKRALERGKHVILEKPATSDLAQLKELVGLARARGVLLLEAVSLHFLPAFLQLKQELPRLGPVEDAEFCYCQYSSRYDAFRRGEVHPVFDWRSSGGALYDINVYNVHAAAALFGKPDRVAYQARVERGIDVRGTLTLDYGTFQVRCVGAKDHQGENRSFIRGKTGSVCIDTPVSQMTAYRKQSPDGTWEVFHAGEVHRLLPELKQMTRMIGQEDLEAAEAMLRVSLTVMEILEQARKQVGVRFAGE